MPRTTERLPLLETAPGTSRHLLVHRFGQAGARPKAYLQASLHADEIPGLLVLHHLIGLLENADAAGAIQGEIVIVPYANPIGLAQTVNAQQLGRFDLMGGGNFNRTWPDLFGPTAEQVEGRLGADADANVAAIRAALRRTVDARKAEKELDSLRHHLARLAVDADIVLDLHCDDDALMHLYLIPAHWPEASDLAAELGCEAVMLADDSGDNPFDETFSTPWTRLAARFPDHPIPPACLSATVELRGYADVSDDLAERDAGALFRVLQRRGLIAGDPGPLPTPRCAATRLDACDVVKSPGAGVLSYAVALGDHVNEGDAIAHLIDPAAEDLATARQTIHSRTAGLVLSRRTHKLAWPGVSVAKIVGTEPLAHRQHGKLAED